MLYFEKNLPKTGLARPVGPVETKSEMSEAQNTTRKNAEQAESSPAAPQSKPKKLWGYVNAFLDYVDEEVPEQQPQNDVPKSKLKKAWASFNVFLDSLEEPDLETSGQQLSGDGEKSGCPLKKTGFFCREAIFHGLILVSLFALAFLVTIKVVDFVNESHVPFYPSREVMQYLMAEHESLEAIADAMPVGDIPLDKFGEQCLDVVKPIRIYSDEYGVYLMTGKNGYIGENGIFIARDEERMPDELSWGLIEGRVFTYAFFE